MERGSETEKRGEPSGEYVEEDKTKDRNKTNINRLAKELTREDKVKETLETEMKNIPQQIQECVEKSDHIYEKFRCQFVPLENQAEGEDYNKKERVIKLARELTSCQDKKSTVIIQQRQISQQIQECEERIHNIQEKMRCQFISFS